MAPKPNFQLKDVTLNQEQIDRLKTTAQQYGGMESDTFKNKVNSQYGVGAYDQLTKNTALGIQAGTVKGNTDVATSILNNNKALNTIKPVYDTGNGEMSDGTTIKNPADEGGFGSGVDYSSGVGQTGTKTKTPLELAQEEIAKKNAEIDKKNKEYEILQNKGATSELTAGVIPGMSGKSEASDFFKGTSDFLQTSLKTELANLDKQKADLEASIKGGQLSEEDQKVTLQPYEQFLDKITKLKDLNDAQIQRDQADLKNRYNTTIDRQRKANELSLTNAQKIAAITGVGFTSGGIQGIGNIIEDGNNAITDLEQERESMLSKYKDADSKLDIEYLDTITTIQNESKKALQDRYNSVVTQIQAIETAKGKATKETLKEIKDVASEYFKALDSQWNKDYKVMEFNYNKFIDYKKDLREDEKIERETQKNQLDLITKGDLTGLSDEDITTLITDMGLDKTTAQGLILTREKQKKDAQAEVNKLALEERKLTEMTPYQKAQYDLDVQKLGLEQAKFKLENGDYGEIVGSGGNYYSDFRISQNVGAKSPNSKDNGYNGGTPGIDFAMPVGTDVVSVTPGKVIKAWSNKDYGTQVIVEDANGNQHMYSHLSDGVVNVGDTVSRGQVIAKSGNTGFSTGPHLDYRVRGIDGKWANPNDFLQGGDKGLVSLGQFMIDNQDRGAGYSNDDVIAFNKKIKRLASEGDENGMAIAYRNMVMKDKDFKKEFDDTKTFTTALDGVQKLINDYEKAGKDTNAAKALAEKVARKLGLSTDEALARLQTQLGVTMANYIRSISGTAASDVEVQRLMGNMAQIGNVKDLNTAIVSQVKDNALNSLKSMVDTRMYGLPDNLKPKVFGDIYNIKSSSTSGNKSSWQDFLNSKKEK